MKYIVKRNLDGRTISIQDTEDAAETYAFNYYLNSGLICDIDQFDDEDFKDHYDAPSEIIVKVIYVPKSTKGNCKDHMFTAISTEYETYKEYIKNDEDILIPNNKKSSSSHVFYMKFKITKDYKNDYEELYNDFENEAYKYIEKYNLLNNEEV